MAQANLLVDGSFETGGTSWQFLGGGSSTPVDSGWIASWTTSQANENKNMDLADISLASYGSVTGQDGNISLLSQHTWTLGFVQVVDVSHLADITGEDFALSARVAKVGTSAVEDPMLAVWGFNSFPGVTADLRGLNADASFTAGAELIADKSISLGSLSDSYSTHTLTQLDGAIMADYNYLAVVLSANANAEDNNSDYIAFDKVSLTVADPPVPSAQYYVATTGSDTNAGTLAQPFATIQHAVGVLLPGDTCTIRGGTYREVVDLSGVAGASGNPITLTAYPNEEVVLDGTIPISSSWTQDSGSIYKTTLSEDIWQLFVDGKMMTLARFPNAPAFSDLMWDLDASRRMKLPDYKSDSMNGRVVDDPDSGAVDALADAGVSFEGCVAMLNFAPPLNTARVITNHVAGSDQFDYSPVIDKYKRHLAYYLEGGVDNAERAMLDSREEWAYDESTKTLYLWADDGLNPDERTIAGKNQSHFFIGDASTRYITIDGLDFFATAFKFSGSDYITVQNCNLDYCAYSQRALGSILWAEPAFFEGSESDFCVECTVYNCEFSYSSGSALIGLYVQDLLVENNLFYHTAYSCASRLAGNTSKMVSTFDIDYSRGCIFRRNTVERSGSSQTVRIRRDYDGPVVPWVVEYNYVTDCSLLQSDGAAIYSPGASVVESAGRYNWMLGNKARDFRWDGANDPVVTSISANIYRNVAMDTGNKGHISNLHPDWKADGYRLKGDLHEIYNNLAIGERSALNVAVDKGGNTNSVTRNNAAEALTPDPIPGIVSNNFIGQDELKNIKQLLRDPDNWDFRPKAEAVELIDQGTPVTCSVDGQNIDITAGYHGAAPDLGAYEYGDTDYWIPGRQLPQASMPVPPSGNRNVKLDADLMWLGGLGATSYEVYFGTDPHSLTAQGSQSNNIFSPGPLAPDTVYYWRVDSIGPNGTVTGDVWTADTTVADTVSFAAAEDTRCYLTNSVNYGTEDPLWIQDNQTRRMVAKFHVSGVGSVHSAILQLTVAEGPIPDIDIYGVAGEWDEMTLTGENDELIWVNLIDTRTNCTAGSTYEFDVSSLVTGDGTYTLGITTDADLPDLKISARESITNAPTLIVTSVTGGAPADADVDGLRDAWELDYFGDLSTTDGSGNQDGDGFIDREEAYAGTNPTNPASFFHVTGMDAADPAGRVITWDAVSNRVYGVYGSTNLVEGIFQPLETNLYYPQDSYTDTVFNAESAGYYKLDVRQQ